MANWTTLKAAIAAVIKTNGNKEITGAILQSTLNSIVSNLGENATFKGIAVPTTIPGTPDGYIFYLANTPGIYANFNSITLEIDELAIIYNNSGNWVKSTLFRIAQLMDSRLNNKKITIGSYISANDGSLNINPLFDGLSLQLYSPKILLVTGTRTYLSNVCAYSGIPSAATYLGVSATYLSVTNGLITINSDLVKYIHVIFNNNGSGLSGYKDCFAIQDGILIEAYPQITSYTAAIKKIISNRNQIKNSRFLFFDKSNNPIITGNQAGTPTYTIEDSLFATKQMRAICKIGDRLHIRSGFTIEAGKKYSAGFFYKMIAGTKKPYIYDFMALTGNALTWGTLRETTMQDGWVFHARENCLANSNYTNANQGFLIDFKNDTGGTEQCECLIAMPMMVPDDQIPEMVLNGYDFAFEYIKTKFLSLDNDIINAKGGDWNLYPDAGMFLVNVLSNGIRTANQAGTNTFVFEKNIFGGKQTRITSPIGARGQLIAPFSIEANTAYSFGFFYKVITGAISPIDSGYILTQLPGNTSIGTTSIIDVKDGWKFFKRENITFNQSSENASGIYIDFSNISGGTNAETLIALPILVKNTTLQVMYPNGTFDALINLFSRVVTLENSIAGNINDWGNKNIALFGDSITAICNGDFIKGAYNLNTWGGILANYFGVGKLFGRGAGGQKYGWGTNGGSVVFVNQTTGNYDSRNDSYNYDNYSGSIPANCIKTRGAFCSWHRIISMFPASIKDTINCIIIKGATNDATDATDLSWLNADTTDTEWHSSTYYATYGGDFNINTLKGGIASTILKMQAWMPQAIILIATPLPGRGTTGQINLTPITDEYTKSIYIRDVAKIFSIPIVDVNANSGINGLNRTTYISDGVHPYSLTGNKMLARTIIGELKKIIPNL